MVVSLSRVVQDALGNKWVKGQRATIPKIRQYGILLEKLKLHHSRDSPEEKASLILCLSTGVLSDVFLATTGQETYH